MLIRQQTPYGQAFEAAYQAMRDHDIAGIYRPRREEGALSYPIDHPVFACAVVMEVGEPRFIDSMRSLMLAGMADKGSDRIAHNSLTLQYHEFLHALTFAQRVPPHDGLVKAHQASGREWNYQRFLETMRGFRLTARHRNSRAYEEGHLDDITALEQHGVSTAYETFAYRVANNMSAEEILGQLRRHDYPDDQIGGISLRQVENVVDAVDRLEALDLDDHAVAGVIAQTAWSYDARIGRYAALEDAIRQRMADVHRFGMETDSRAQARQARKTRDLCRVREVVEGYLLEHP